jgi:hypothetical protein
MSRYVDLSIAVHDLLEFIYKKYSKGESRNDFVFTCPHHKELARLIEWQR